MIEQTAMSAACRSLGYTGTAAMIELVQVARLLGLGASLDAGHVVALVALAAGTARHYAQPHDWLMQKNR